MSKWKLLFVFLFLSMPPCFTLDKTPLFEAIEYQDTSRAIQFFEELDSLTTKEALDFLDDFFDYCISRYNLQNATKEDCFKSFYDLILREKNSSQCVNFTDYQNKCFFPFPMNPKKRKEDPLSELNAEIPGSMILGGVEMVSGTLLSILPFPATRVIGGVLISDGIRRGFNGLEELDQENKNHSPFNRDYN